MTLTVAIPSYNKEKYIDRCIKSVLAEKEYTHIDEIILVDNCSTDKTFELAKKYEPQIKCVRNLSNLGMSGNFNRCIDLCENDLLMIFHADDELLPNTIKHYLDFFKEHPAVGLAHANFFYVKNGDLSTKQYVKSDTTKIRKAGLEALEMGGNACSTVIVKKSAYDALGYFMESMSSDFEMWRRVGSKYDIGHLDIPTVNVHLNADSTASHSFLNREIGEIEKDWKRLSDKINSYYPKEFQKTNEEYRKGMVDSFIIVATACIKGGQYKKAMQAIKLIFIKYRGFFRVLKNARNYLKYRFKQ